MFAELKLSPQEWLEVKAYWLAEPRGERRDDLRAALAAVLPGSKDAAKAYFGTFGLNQGDRVAEDRAAKFVEESKNMKTAEMVAAWFRQQRADMNTVHRTESSPILQTNGSNQTG